MVLNNTNDEWVAFSDDVNAAGFEAGLESFDCPNDNLDQIEFGEKSSKYDDTDTTTVATWMKKPINSDASWAPVSPPAKHRLKRNKDNPVIAHKKRPPKAPKSPLGSRDDSNPISSSSESSSSRSRARSPKRTSSRPITTAPMSIDVSLKSHNASRTKSSSIKPSKRESSRNGKGRGRSRTRNLDASQHKADSAIVQAPVAPIPLVPRGRSTSQNRPATRERSSSRQSTRSIIRAADNKLRNLSRPPVTSPLGGNRLPETHHRSRSNSRNPVPRSRSTSRPRSNNLPPTTHRPRKEMRNPVHDSRSVGGPAPQQRRSTNGGSSRSFRSIDERSMRSADPNIGRDISFGRTQSDASNKSGTEPMRKRSPMMEKLFGDQVSNGAKQAYLPRSASPAPSSIGVWQQPERIHSRILLTATVYHNTATNLWIATINTNQKGVAKNPAKASRYLKAFSFSTEKEARESAIANAPPKMMKFSDNSNCFICQGRFAMFRRASHCRNCGVCICNACSTSWPSKAIPETYNLKKESQVKICRSCNFLSGAFKRVLLAGDYEEAIALYGSGNINLRTPFPQFSSKKEEVMYPIHCAIEGGNLNIVQWLMEDHFCPVKVIRTSGSGGVKRTKKGANQDYPILTSKNRSVLTIAMDNLHVKVLRYLVVDKGVSIYESRDLKGSLRALEAVLNALPSGLGEYRSDGFAHRWDDDVYDEGTSVASSLGADATFPGSEYDGSATHRADGDNVGAKNFPSNAILFA
uniref:FYVE-type domain-containing protein n=1 Tax=Pseudo-nitzschia australis TaxID=44445 RepID=A0A7S4AH86_9STRA